jgi:hypothetical protein
VRFLNRGAAEYAEAAESFLSHRERREFLRPQRAQRTQRVFSGHRGQSERGKFFGATEGTKDAEKKNRR